MCLGKNTKSGIKYLHFSRHEPGIYHWYSPDGSNVLAFTPGHYYVAGSTIEEAKTEEETKTAFIISNNIFHNSINNITNAIDFKKDDRAVIVFNPLSWERTDKVEVNINAYGQDRTSFKIIDAFSGEEVPCQRIESVSTKETDEVVTLTFVAEKVPSMGYKTYYLQSGNHSYTFTFTSGTGNWKNS